MGSFGIVNDKVTDPKAKKTMDTFDSPYTSHQNNQDCFSASELAYEAAKGCVVGVATDLAISTFTPLALHPGTVLGFCAAGALGYGADSLIDSFKCVLER